MTDKRTIVALFESREAAAEAVEALLASTFTEGDIDSVSEVGPNARGNYPEAVRAGKIVVAVRAWGDLETRALTILGRHKPDSLETYPFSWKEQGWEGFEVAASETEADAIADTRAYYDRMKEEWEEQNE